MWQVLKYSALSANISTEEPIDMVMHDSYPGKASLWQEYTLIKFIPFNPVDKFTMAIVKENATGKIQRVMKGAPQVTLPNIYLYPSPCSPGPFWTGLLMALNVCDNSYIHSNATLPRMAHMHGSDVRSRHPVQV